MHLLQSGTWKKIFEGTKMIVTARKRSLRRLCFYRCLVCPTGGGNLGGCAWFYSGGCVVLNSGGMVVLFGGQFRGACVVLNLGACVVLHGFIRGHWFYSGGCFFGYNEIRSIERAVRMECTCDKNEFQPGQSCVCTLQCAFPWGWGVGPGPGGGGCIPACTEADTPPPVDRILDNACENITLAQLRCGR